MTADDRIWEALTEALLAQGHVVSEEVFNTVKTFFKLGYVAGYALSSNDNDSEDTEDQLVKEFIQTINNNLLQLLKPLSPNLKTPTFNEYYFCVVDDDTDDHHGYYYIAHKTFWNENKCLDDRCLASNDKPEQRIDGTQLYAALNLDDFNEVEESVFECTKLNGRQLLLNLGMEENKDMLP